MVRRIERRVELSTVLERISTARESKNLKANHDKQTDLDVLTAVAYATRHVNKSAGAIMDLHLSDTVEAGQDAIMAVYRMVVRMNLRRRWGHNLQQDLVAIARHAVRYHKDPTCPICKGRKFETMAGAPMLSDRPCGKCQGTGRRPFPIKKGKEIRETVTAIESIEQQIESEVERRLFMTERAYRRMRGEE